ncbi:polynucleotide phosphorylase [Candidatus Phytoplasma oryzae]|uniref:Polyribonucleotide nucleotidyltransferase n=2 Tax=Candidatus Phytoplasma oryzae TaxID=203274 RepID=A0A328IKM8_9MOLU|nr:polyribonucleotide nucleotidyltransferase [Candidatus Phytoplasma oryzae]RAM57860.1 polynucleotide phosphorylase [Candidatus Phytoplasma oryzae]
MNYHKFKTIFENNLLTIEINKLARQANGTVLVSYNDTVILSVALMKDLENTLNYFPLMVLYQEKLYAAGKIPGSFSKREGKPSDQEILNARLIDRSLRPLFDNKFKNEVQLVNTVLSSNIDCNNEVLALLGSSLSLLISDIPFEEPVAGVCVGKVNNKLIINPNAQERENSEFLLILSGTQKNINMIEAIAKETLEEDLLEAMILGHKFIKKLCIFQQKIKKKINPQKKNVLLSENNKKLQEEIFNKYNHKIKEIFYCSDNKNNIKIPKKEINQKIKKIKNIIIKEYRNNDENINILLDKTKEKFFQIEDIFDILLKNEIRFKIIKEQKRIDDRSLDEIRNINIQIKLLPRVHGSAIFNRGETQSLAVVTLGSLNESKTIDDLSEEEEKRFILHYNFPSFSVGEVGRYLAPTRREIGHGMLAEKALSYLLPSEDEFPYTIRVVSEILESNGSSSQATICATSMALMDAGVPIKKAVAGISIGLFYENDQNYFLVSDINGLEDYAGDMDFKVAGTKKGITTLQMDIKIKNVNFNILKEALQKAKIGRMHILKAMNLIISEPRANLSFYAPKVKIIKIKTDKIRDVIGAGGKIISRIIEKYDNVKIDIQQDGKILIFHQNSEIVEKASEYILNLVKDIKVGEIYKVTVLKFLTDKKGQDFGVIVEIFPGIEGFIHISEISFSRISKIKNVMNIGDILIVKCISVNGKGRIEFSLKDYNKKIL